MKHLFTLITLFLFAVAVHAQMPQGMPPGGRTTGANIGHIYGKILDADGKPLSDVSLLIMQKKYDSVSKKNQRSAGKRYDNQG